MTLFSYEIFDAVARQGSFNKAAQQLHLTPSAISHAIAVMEAELGFTLFNRGKNGVTMTSYGASLYPSIRAVLNSDEALQQSIARLNGLEKGKVKLGAFNSVCAGLLPQILKSFMASYPQIEVEVYQGTYDDVKEWLRTGQVDMAFLSNNCRDEFTLTELFRQGMFEDPYADPRKAAEVVATKADWEEASRVHRESVVLLKNDGGLLPLAKAPGRIALIGPFGDDKANLVHSLVAKTEFAVPRTVARVNHPSNEWMFDEVWGVDVAVSTPRLMCALVEEAVTVGDLVRLFSFRGGKTNLVEMTLPFDSPIVGRRVADLNLPGDFVLVAVIRDGEARAPQHDAALEGGDELLFIGNPDAEHALAQFLAPSEQRLQQGDDDDDDDDD